MQKTISSMFNNKALNGWNLWRLITIPISVVIIAMMMTKDLSRVQDISSMIQFSVRCSVPWLYLAFAAAAVRALFPGPIGPWLARNRRYIGLCFAAAMGWQLFFILWMVVGFWQFYVEDVYLFEDLLFQLPGYMLLIAMTLTSFKHWRSKITAQQWKLLHTFGIYFLWFTVWYTYWYELYVYQDIQIIDHVYYWSGLMAFGLRIMAWNKQRWFSNRVTA
jgi:sulfoxide reductase heme-binding subunit YedZ